MIQYIGTNKTTFELHSGRSITVKEGDKVSLMPGEERQLVETHPLWQEDTTTQEEDDE